MRKGKDLKDVSVDELAMLAKQGDPAAQAKVAKIYFQQGNNEKGIYWVKKSSDQGHRPAKCMLAVIYLTSKGQNRDPELGLSMIKELAEDGYAQAQFQLGEFYEYGKGGVEKDDKKAHKWYAAAADNGHEEAEERSKRLFKSIVREFDKQTQIMKLETDKYNKLGQGRTLLESGRYQEAISQLNTALEIKEGGEYNCDCYYYLADAWLGLENYEKAVFYYDRTIEAMPNHYNAFNGKGFVLNKLGKFDEAISCFDKAIQNSNFANPHNHKGLALFFLYKYDEALESCKKALSIESKYAGAYNNMANILFQMKRYPESLEAFKNALVHNPSIKDMKNFQDYKKIRSDYLTAEEGPQKCQIEIQLQEMLARKEKENASTVALVTEVTIPAPQLSTMASLQPHNDKDPTSQPSVSSGLIDQVATTTPSQSSADTQPDFKPTSKDSGNQPSVIMSAAVKQSMDSKNNKEEYLRLLNELKEAKPDTLAELNKLNEKFKELEHKAIEFRDCNFYQIRGDFYYQSATKETRKMRQDILFANALQDYHKAINYNPFVEGVIERIEEIEGLSTKNNSSTPNSHLFKPEPTKIPKREELTSEELAEVEKIKERLRQQSAATS